MGNKIEQEWKLMTENPKEIYSRRDNHVNQLSRVQDEHDDAVKYQSTKFRNRISNLFCLKIVAS